MPLPLIRLFCRENFEDKNRVQVEILSPPEGAVPGDLVTVAGFEGEPDAIIKPSSKNKVSAFEQVAPDLKTNDALEATYKVCS